jgi:hypothetical protein
MELRRPLRFSSVALSTAGAVSVVVVVVAFVVSSELSRGLPELPRRLSNAPNTLFRPVFGDEGDPMGGELLPSDIPP